MTLKINSRDRDAVFNLAKAYNDFAWRAFVSGRKQEAIGYWKRTLSVNPSNKATKYYLKKYGF
jgi:tetratricopeptide (TPR) repeat protein